MPIDPNSKEAFALTLKYYRKELLEELLTHLDYLSEFNEKTCEIFIKEKAPSYPFDKMKLSDSWQRAQATICQCNENKIEILLGPDFHKISNQYYKKSQILFYRGTLQQSDESITNRTMAIVGSREIKIAGGEEGLTKNLKDNLDKLCRNSKYKWSIVSGLALGCDTIAHKMALELDIRTIAVLPTGLSSGDIYPPSNRGLAEKIVKQDGGLLVSEYAPKTPIQNFHFPSRDKIQAALSEVLLVLDCHPKSGTLHTLAAAKRLKKRILHNDQMEDVTKKILEEKFGSVPINLEDQSSLCSSINLQDVKRTQDGVQQGLGF